ncbi:MAG: DUF1697 domain-containing protein [Bryobacteraceae bacterium]
MPAYVALLRAVNVGGTGKLPMSQLKAACAAEGYTNVQTYIASGNVVFASKHAEAKVKTALETSLGVRVFVRTAAGMAAILQANPFLKAAPNRVIVFFLDGAPGSLEGITGQKNEELRPGKREIFVHYPDGQGQSKLKIPAGADGTGRNMNTVAKLAEMAAKL